MSAGCGVSPLEYPIGKQVSPILHLSSSSSHTDYCVQLRKFGCDDVEIIKEVWSKCPNVEYIDLSDILLLSLISSFYLL